jgi:hypothetical protein
LRKEKITPRPGLHYYEHACDQGTLGSVTDCRHSRTPGRTYDFLIVRGGPCLGPGWPIGRPRRESRDKQLDQLARLCRLTTTTKVLYKTRSLPIR